MAYHEILEPARELREDLRHAGRKLVEWFFGDRANTRDTGVATAAIGALVVGDGIHFGEATFIAGGAIGVVMGAGMTWRGRQQAGRPLPRPIHERVNWAEGDSTPDVFTALMTDAFPEGLTFDEKSS